MEAFLKKSKDIQGVFAQNDEMGLGAVQALKEAGLKPGEDVKIITVDATKGAFQAMIDGDINTVVECNPLLAPAGLRGGAQGGQRRRPLPKWVPSRRACSTPGRRRQTDPAGSQVLSAVTAPAPTGRGAGARAPVCPTIAPRRRDAQVTPWQTMDAAPVHARAFERASPACWPSTAWTSTLRRGEIHALVGENGAGKSTLIKVLTGVERPDSGTIAFDGQSVHVRSPLHAQALGISTVYQEVNLCPNLSVGENILHRPCAAAPGPDRLAAMHRRAAEHPRAASTSTSTYPAARLPTRSRSSRWPRSPGRSRSRRRGSSSSTSRRRASTRTRPSSSSASCASCGATGIAIVFITHFLDQVYAIADRITVLRNGRLVGDVPDRRPAARSS